MPMQTIQSIQFEDHPLQCLKIVRCIINSMILPSVEGVGAPEEQLCQLGWPVVAHCALA